MNRRKFLGVTAAAGLTATVPVATAAREVGHIPRMLDLDTKRLEEILEPLVGQLFDTSSSAKRWSVWHAPRQHSVIILYLDVYNVGASHHFTKNVPFELFELIGTDWNLACIKRRLETLRKMPWRRVGLYEVDDSYVPDDHAFDMEET